MSSQNCSIEFLADLCKLVYTGTAQRFILCVIVVNAIVLGLMTDATIMRYCGSVLEWLDGLALLIFVIELTMKLIASRWRFFSLGWNWFDFLIVVISLLPSAGNLSVMRVLRVFRVFRLVSGLPRLRELVQVLLYSLPSIGWILLLLVIFYYATAVLVTGMFGDTHPEYFGSIGASMFTLFQVMTMDAWATSIVRPLLHSHPYALLVFVPFLLISAFIVVNIFVAILIKSMEDIKRMDRFEKTHTVSEQGIRSRLLKELEELKHQIENIEFEIDDRQSKLIAREEESSLKSSRSGAP